MKNLKIDYLTTTFDFLIRYKSITQIYSVTFSTDKDYIFSGVVCMGNTVLKTYYYLESANKTTAIKLINQYFKENEN